MYVYCVVMKVSVLALKVSLLCFFEVSVHERLVQGSVLLVTDYYWE
jgi:hypothetical protein